MKSRLERLLGIRISDKQFYLSIFVALLIIIPIVVFWLSRTTLILGSSMVIWQPAAKESQKNGMAFSFIQTGNITNYNSTLQKDTGEWKLLYEKPGMPALTIDLKFDLGSICSIGGKTKICDLSKLQNGTRAKVEGYLRGRAVYVAKLTEESD